MDQLPPHVWAYDCRTHRPRCVKVPVIVIGEDQIETHGRSAAAREWPRRGNDLTR